MDRQSNAAANGAGPAQEISGKVAQPTAIEKAKVARYIVPASVIQTPIRGHEIMDAVHRSIGSFPTIVAEVKELLRGVEADVRAVETIQLIEEPDKRTLLLQRKYHIRKDR